MWTCLFMAPREDSVKYTIRTIAIISNAIIHNSAATDKSAVKHSIKHDLHEGPTEWGVNTNKTIISPRFPLSTPTVHHWSSKSKNPPLYIDPHRTGPPTQADQWLIRALLLKPTFTPFVVLPSLTLSLSLSPPFRLTFSRPVHSSPTRV